MKNNIKIIIAAALAVACLSGCGSSSGGYNPPPAPAAPQNTYSTPSVQTPAVSSSAPAVYSDVTPSEPAAATKPETSKPEATSSEPAASEPAASDDDMSDITSKLVCVRSDKITSSGSSGSSGNYNWDDLVAIKKICGLKSGVEKSVDACIVDVNSTVNPYDVVYDYGKDYDAYVAKCDWSLVFDADYYMSEFPILAWQYNYDAKLLLKHFQTVGIHEGRQGNKSFNVGAYKTNCDSTVSGKFGDNYEGYYFYYMLNQATEKSVSATAGTGDKTQYKIVMTALQSEELKGANMYRSEVGSADLAFASEIAAMANKRAYINAHDRYNAHDWAKANNDAIWNKLSGYSANIWSENMCQRACKDSYGRTHYECYRNSESHYKAMINSRYDLFGCSNSYCATGYTCQFDFFVDL